MIIQESGEMYLETILVLEKTNDIVHAIDIAQYMGVSKPAVSKALAKYKEEKLLKINTSGNITLTNEGLSIAKKVYERHVLLTDFLVKLGVDEETAATDACRIEHVISEKSFDALKDYVKATLSREPSSHGEYDTKS